MKKLSVIVALMVVMGFAANAQMCPKVTGTNSVTNGNFQGGCASFSSEYTFNGTCNGGSINPGQWTVSNNANARNSYFTNPTGANPPGEPAGATNQYLIIDADGTSGKDAYRTTVNVLNGTTYFFSAWISNINGTFENPPVLRFSINGVQLGANLTASATTHDWEQFYVAWTSNVAGPIDIRLENLITTSNGNDLAIDAINFNTSCSNIPNIETLGQSSALPDTVYNCNVAFPYTLNPGLPGSYALAWKKVPATTLSTAATYNEPPTPADGSKVYLCYEFITGCPRTDSVIFKVTPIHVNLGPDKVRCLPVNEVLSSGVSVPPVSIQWQLNGVNIGGATNSTYTATLPGTYTANATRTGCTAGSDAIVITSPTPTFTGTGNFCAAGNTADFTVTGTTQVKWYTAASGGSPLNPSNTNPTISLPYASTNTTTPGCASGLYAEDVSSFNGTVGPTTKPCTGTSVENGNRSAQMFKVNQDLTLNSIDIVQPPQGFAGSISYVVKIVPTKIVIMWNGSANVPVEMPDIAATPIFTSAAQVYNHPSVATVRTLTVGKTFTGVTPGTNYGIFVEANNGVYYQDCAGSFPYNESTGHNAIQIVNSIRDNGNLTTNYGHSFNWNFTAGNVFSCGRLWICAIDNCSAPVELIQFDVKKYSEGNAVSWKTASEQNSAYFIVQRSVDGINFEDLGRVAAAGNSTAVLSYSFLDNTYPLGAEVVYYRLRQVDIDATAHYSEIKTVRSDQLTQAISLYPVPVKRGQNVFLNYNSASEEIIVVEIYDNPGKVVSSGQYTVLEGANSIELNTASLSSGLYHLRIGGKAAKFIVE